MRSIGAQLVAVSLSALFTSEALAQEWTFVDLHPEGALWSACNGASGGQQVGWVLDFNNSVYYQPCVWTGSASPWHVLDTYGVDSKAYGIDAGQVVGEAGLIDGFPPMIFRHACLWTADGSFVDLHLNNTLSVATGISASRQVGYQGPAFDSAYATMWTGSPASRVYLHPSGATASYALGCHSDQQVGYAVFSRSKHAGLWAGTAGSWIDLNPVGASSSEARGVYAGEQVGYCVINGITHACLWHGTTASWVDLAPAGAAGSSANAVFEGIQVGYAVIGDIARAGLWRGTAESWVDLSAYLPSEFSGWSLHANGISSDGDFLYVVGTAYAPYPPEVDTRAVMWKAPIPCEGDLDGNRLVDLEDLAVLLSNYGTPEGATAADGDLDGDGDVDLQDLATLLARFGSTCP